jgi:DNA-binding NarL/FixJ family response regulator
MEASNRKIRVLVADDSRTALRSICEYLQFEDQFEIVATAPDGIRLLHQAERYRPELVLTDLSMPGMTGLEAARSLRRSFPEMRILIFTELHGASLQEECIRSGANGLIEKSQMPEGLMEEVRRLFPQNPQQ